MPKRRRTSGRHRRQHHSKVPSSVALIAGSAIVVGGMHVPAALGDGRPDAAPTADPGQLAARTSPTAAVDTSAALAAPAGAASPGLIERTELASARASARLRASRSRAEDSRSLARVRLPLELTAASVRAAEATPSTSPEQARGTARNSSVAPTKDRVATRASRSRRTPAARRAGRPAVWTAPLTSYRLSAGFGQRSSLWRSVHTGQDFAAPSGTPVRAVGAGVVTSVSYAGSYGRRVEIRHGDGSSTWYCHLSSYASRAGQRVRAGQVIGRVGSTGNSTGPHLHLEVHRPGGGATNPLSWLRGHGVSA